MASSLLAFLHSITSTGMPFDEEDHVLPCAIVTVVKGPLFGDFKNVARWLVVIDQDQVALAALLLVEELAPVTQVLDKFPVAVDVGVEITKSAEQRAFGLSVTRVELPHLGIKQAVEEERTTLGALLEWRIRIKPAPPLGFFAGHNRPADGLGIFENAGLHGFVFGGSGHLLSFLSFLRALRTLRR